MKETISITNFSGLATLKVSSIILLQLLAISSSTLEFAYYRSYLRLGSGYQSPTVLP